MGVNCFLEARFLMPLVLSMFLFGTGPSDINGANVFRRAVEFVDGTLFGDATHVNVHPTEEQS